MEIYYDRINKEVESVCKKYKVFGNLFGVFSYQTPDNDTFIINIVVNKPCSMPMKFAVDHANEYYRFCSLNDFGVGIKIRLISNKKFEDIGVGYINDEIDILTDGVICYDPTNELHRVQDSGLVLKAQKSHNQDLENWFYN